MKILDFNHCNLPDCKCGWNVLLGGVSDKELNQLRKFLAGKVYGGRNEVRRQGGH